jgi:hypothetical protein
MSWTHWPLTTASDAQKDEPWIELVSAINERCAVVGVDTLAIPTAQEVWFQRGTFASIMDKLNELLPLFLDDGLLEGGNQSSFPYYPLRIFTLAQTWVVQTLDSCNELYRAVNGMNRTVAGNGVIASGGAYSINGDWAQHPPTGGTGSGALWYTGYADAATARTTLWTNWNSFRGTPGDTEQNGGLSWAMTTIINMAKESSGVWYGMFDADWSDITSLSDVDMKGLVVPAANMELYAKLYPSFWTVLPNSEAWRSAPFFTDYPFRHPGGLKHGLWGKFGVGSSWNGSKPVTTAGNNPCTTEPVEQNWALYGPAWYVSLGQPAQYDSQWIIKWPFEKAV